MVPVPHVRRRNFSGSSAIGLFAESDVAKARVYDGLAMERKKKDFYLCLASLSASASDMGCSEKDLWLLNRLYIFMLMEISNVVIMASCGRIVLLCTFSYHC